MKAILEWIPEEKGGRRQRFTGDRYAPNIRIGDDFWSIVFSDMSHDTAETSNAQVVRFFAEPPPQVHTDDEYRYVITEGSRPVAIARFYTN